MKSAYELAMERLNQSAPLKQLSQEQKKEIQEIDNRYSAKLAEREITMKGEIAKAQMQGDYSKIEELEQQWALEKKKLESEREDKKEAIRNAN